MQINPFTVGGFQANCFLVTDPATGLSALFDVGEDGAIARHLEVLEPRPDLAWILLTHAHLDHAGGLAAVQEVFPAPTALSKLERPLFEALPQQGNWFGMPGMNRPCGAIKRWLDDGDTVEVGELRFEVLVLPGHSPGVTCYHGHGHLFAGDLLFQGSIGRTDLPLGDGGAMEESLERIMSLPGETTVHPGHGPDTTLQRELETNPFLAGVRRKRGLPEPAHRSWW